MKQSSSKRTGPFLWVHDKKVMRPVTSGVFWFGGLLGLGGALARRRQSAGSDGPGFVDGFTGRRRGVVGEELAVVEELLGDEAGVAQAGFQVLDQCFDALFFLEEFPAGLGGEDLGFPVLFRKALGLEVFISGVSAAAACPVRRDRVCWMLSWASCWQSCSKRWQLSMC